MWTSLRIYIYKIVDFINGLSGLLYRTGWTSVNGILNKKRITWKNTNNYYNFKVYKTQYLYAINKDTKANLSKSHNTIKAKEFKQEKYRN